MTHVVNKGHSESSVKVCSQCSRRLHELYPYDICPVCKENNLFNEVKDYIRKNDVREQEVADHFQISVHKVRNWIKEGRIQYKGDPVNSVSSLYCKICGKPISFGILCPECHSPENIKVVVAQEQIEDASMRFLGK